MGVQSCADAPASIIPGAREDRGPRANSTAPPPGILRLSNLAALIPSERLLIYPAPSNASLSAADALNAAPGDAGRDAERVFGGATPGFREDRPPDYPRVRALGPPEPRNVFG